MLTGHGQSGFPFLSKVAHTILSGCGSDHSLPWPISCAAVVPYRLSIFDGETIVHVTVSSGVGVIAAWIARSALFVFVIYFTALDAIGGNGPLAKAV